MTVHHIRRAAPRKSAREQRDEALYIAACVVVTVCYFALIAWAGRAFLESFPL